MSGATRLRPKRHPNGLAMFASTVVVLALGIVIGANLLFDRSAARPLPPDTQSAAASPARTSAPSPAAGRTSGPAAAAASG
jgi:hypothetical protein